MAMSYAQDTPEASTALDITNVVAAFSEEQAEKLTGLTKGRLRYWAKTGFFCPSYVEENARLPYSRFYSFKDIVALRTLEMLRVRNKIPLQYLRKVAEKLSSIKDNLWADTKLAVVGRKVVVVDPETGAAEEPLSGQFVMIQLNRIIDETRLDVSKIKLRPRDSIGKVERRRSIARNAWVISGTRIPINAIIRLHEDGYSFNEIISEYPDITASDIEAALEHSNHKSAS
jgi:DNA-binding transcriptional MerR regulator